MLLQKENSPGPIKIDAYQAGILNISGKKYNSAVTLTPTEVKILDKAIDFSSLNADFLFSMIPEQTEIFLLGSGINQKFLPLSEVNQLNKRGIAIEVMATRQACHTFQILAFENRKVFALLFP